MNKNNLTLEKEENWDFVIKPQSHLLDINFQDIWRYRDLLYMFVKRSIVTMYKQTVLGPLWFFIQPILTMLVYIVVFGGIAKISTDGMPQPLFYISGIIFWNFFATCLRGTSNTFRGNAGIFGKVYFPRLIMPLSTIVSNFIKFLIQSVMLIIVFVYYYFYTSANINPHWELIWVIPIMLLVMALMGLSFGLILSAMTTKYRDLSFLMGFITQLLMYATPVIYPMSILEGKYSTFIWYNPMAHIIEGVKYIILGSGHFNVSGLLYSMTFTFIIFIIGMIIFHKTEKDFIDTV